MKFFLRTKKRRNHKRTRKRGGAITARVGRKLACRPSLFPVDVGFPNVGNTCWMNACLQVFLRLPGAEELLTKYEEAHSRLKESKNIDVQGLTVPYEQLHILVESLSLAKKAANRNFIRNFRRSLNNYFEHGRQEDSYEFVNRFLTQIEPFSSLTKHVYSQTIVEADSPEDASLKWEDLKRRIDEHAAEKDAFVQHILKNNVNKQDVLEALHLPKKPTDRMTYGVNHIIEVNSLFGLPSLPAILAGGQSFEKVEHTSYENGAYKNLSDLVSSPPVFVFGINRLGLDGKDTSYIDFPLEAVIRDTAYKLHGFVVHLGDGGGGHYVSCVKTENKWYYYNDSVVTVCDGYDDAVTQSRAFVKDKSDNRNVVVYVRS